MPLEAEGSDKVFFSSVDPVAPLGDIGIEIRRRSVAFAEAV